MAELLFSLLVIGIESILILVFFRNTEVGDGHPEVAHSET